MVGKEVRKEKIKEDGKRLEFESSNETGARCGQFESFNGEWEIIIGGIVDEETVVNALLQAFRLVTGGHQWAGLSSSITFTFFNAGMLIVLDAIRFDFVDDDTPFAFGVDCT